MVTVMAMVMMMTMMMVVMMVMLIAMMVTIRSLLVVCDVRLAMFVRKRVVEEKKLPQS